MKILTIVSRLVFCACFIFCFQPSYAYSQPDSDGLKDASEDLPMGLPIDEQGKQKDLSGWIIHFDNDLLIPSAGRDQDYTGGLGVTLAGEKSASSWWSIDRPLGALDRVLGLDSITPDAFELNAAQFGLLVFSPSDIGSTDAIYDDRPFASLLYLANSRRYISSPDKPVYQSTLTLGMLGTDLAADIQNGIHEMFGSETPNGWDHQISQGGEPTFQYSVNRQDLLATNFDSNNITAKQTEYEVKYTVTGSLGYITETSVALSGRWGKINTPWWSFTPENGDYASQPSPVIGNSGIGSFANELYIWGGLKLRARAYNVFLQGQFQESDVTFDNNELRHLIAEAWFGVTSQWGRYRISYVSRFQTKEIKAGTGARNPIWGGLIFAVDY